MICIEFVGVEVLLLMFVEEFEVDLFVCLVELVRCLCEGFGEGVRDLVLGWIILMLYYDFYCIVL